MLLSIAGVVLWLENSPQMHRLLPFYAHGGNVTAGAVVGPTHDTGAKAAIGFVEIALKALLGRILIELSVRRRRRPCLERQRRPARARGRAYFGAALES